MMRWAHWVLAKYAKLARCQKAMQTFEFNLCVCRFFLAKYLFRLRADFGGISSAFSHTGGTWFTSPRGGALLLLSRLSRDVEFSLWCCVRRRGSGSSKLIFDWDPTLLRWLREMLIGDDGRRTPRVWFYASLSHKIFAPINIWTFL
jgi:hypothetical protein